MKYRLPQEIDAIIDALRKYYHNEGEEVYASILDNAEYRIEQRDDLPHSGWYNNFLHLTIPSNIYAEIKNNREYYENKIQKDINKFNNDTGLNEDAKEYISGVFITPSSEDINNSNINIGDKGKDNINYKYNKEGYVTNIYQFLCNEKKYSSSNLVQGQLNTSLNGEILIVDENNNIIALIDVLSRAETPTQQFLSEQNHRRQSEASGFFKNVFAFTFSIDENGQEVISLQNDDGLKNISRKDFPTFADLIKRNINNSSALSNEKEYSDAIQKFLIDKKGYSNVTLARGVSTDYLEADITIMDNDGDIPAVINVYFRDKKITDNFINKQKIIQKKIPFKNVFVFSFVFDKNSEEKIYQYNDDGFKKITRDDFPTYNELINRNNINKNLTDEQIENSTVTLDPKKYSESVFYIIGNAYHLATSNNPRSILDIEHLFALSLFVGSTEKAYTKNQNYAFAIFSKNLGYTVTMLAGFLEAQNVFKNIDDFVDTINGVMNIQLSRQNMPIPMSNGVKDLLSKATEIANSTTDTGLTHQRHLLTAMLLERKKYPILKSFFASLDTKVISFAKEYFPTWGDLLSDKSSEWQKLARKIAGENFSEKDDDLLEEENIEFTKDDDFARHVSDDLSEKDLMGVEDDALGLARLIMDERQESSLAIGIFGKWGSGKSNFFHFLRKKIDITAFEGETKKSPFASKVCHITFNAWHYHDSNLWASIMVHIFDNLARFYSIKKQDGDDKEKLSKLANGEYVNIDNEEEYQAIQKELVSLIARKDKQLSKVTCQITEANNEISAIEKKIDAQLIEENTIAKACLKIIQKQIQQWLKSQVEINKIFETWGISKDIEAFEQTKDDFSECCSTYWGPWIKLITWIKHNKLKGVLMGVFILLSIILIPCVLNVLLTKISSLPEFAKNLSTFTSFFGLIITNATLWINKLQRASSKVSEALNEIDKQVEKIKETDEYKNEESQLNIIKNKIKQLATQKETLEYEKNELVQAQKDLNPNELLRRFITDRLNTDSYTKHLGLISEIRKDFESLEMNLLRTKSDINEEGRAQKEDNNNDVEKTEDNDGNNKPVYKLDRIILYIDDLDRCKYDTIMEVLQAVHLLLGFKLFTVVLGVDTRWLVKSIKNSFMANIDQRYDSEINHAAHNYLEKIIQIPYCLAPMNHNSIKSFVDLIQVNTEVPRVSLTDDYIPPSNSSSVMDREPSTSRSKKDEEEIIPQDILDECEPKYPVPTYLTKEEILYLGKYKWLQVTPRILKRMLNIYRIIRVSLNLGNEEYNTFISEKHYKILWLLICIQNTHPKQSFNVFKKIYQDGELQGWLDNIFEDHKEIANKEMTKENIKIYTVIHNNCNLDVELNKKLLREYICKVSKFNFDLESYLKLCTYEIEEET